MSFLRGNLLARMRTLVKGGVREKPRWFDAVSKVPPETLKSRYPKPPKIRYPEDPLVESYYARHPEAKLQPISVQSFDPPLARLFAQRQLELMQGGMSKREARDKTEEEFAAIDAEVEELEKAERMTAMMEGRPLPPKKSLLQQIQEEEWDEVRHGLEVTAMELRKSGAS